MEITFYDSGFTKRENSTKRPNSQQVGYVRTGTIKEPCSILKPVIKIERLNRDNEPSFLHYAYIPRFNRYYYVTDWVWMDGVWECHMKVDTLASHRSLLIQTNAYIERTSAPSYISGNIIDNLYPATVDYVFDMNEFEPAWSKFSASVMTNQFFVIGVVGKPHASAISATTYYKLTMTQMQALMTYLMSDEIYSDMGFGGLSEALSNVSAKAIYNPIQYITSCFLFHCDVADFPLGVLDDIQIGPYPVWDQTGIAPPNGYIKKLQGYALGSNAVFTTDKTISLPADHPQKASRGSFLQYQPFTRYTAFIPPFGTIPIDPSVFSSGDDISFYTIFDGATGKGRMIIRVATPDPETGTYSYVPIFETSTMFGIPINLAQVSVDYLNASLANVDASVHAFGAASSLVSGNFTGAASGVSMALHSIASATESLSPQLMMQGANGSAIAFFGKPVLYARYVILADDDVADMGRPACVVANLGDVGNDGGDWGNYIKCGEVHIDFDCLDDEKEELNNYLLSGFFFE